MSTPTAAGITASLVGITDPTVEPIPTCASAISATCGVTNGNEAVSSACANAWGSMIEAHE